MLEKNLKNKGFWLDQSVLDAAKKKLGMRKESEVVRYALQRVLQE